MSAPDPNLEARENAAAERAQQAAREAAHWLRGEVGRIYEGYNRQSKFFKWRAWIVAAYVALSATSVVLALPELNSIDAYVVPTTDFRGRLILSVENQSGEEWTHVKLYLDDKWVFEKDSLPAGEKVLPNVTQFFAKKSKETRAPEDLRPKRYRIVTDQGEYGSSLYAE